MNNNTDQAIKVFKEGGVVVFPTDTAYGIGCRMDNLAAVDRVFSIKKRSRDNALLVLVDSIEMAEKYVIFDNKSLLFAKKHWPGGLSIFLKCREEKVPSEVRAGTDILALRWPDHPQMLEIIREVGVPIIATSANISGGETPYSLDEVDPEIKNSVSYVLEGECTYKKESTIVDCTVDPWKIIRQGAVDIEIL